MAAPVRVGNKVAQASSPASEPGVPPGRALSPGGGTPPALAGEDACATLRPFQLTNAGLSKRLAPEYGKIYERIT